MEVPRRNPGSYVPRSGSPLLRPGNAFTPPEPVPIGPAVQHVSRIIEDRLQRAEEVGLLEADNQLADAAVGLRTQALEKRGKDALAAGARVQEDWEKTVSQVESTLTSDRQRENFRLRSQQHWRQLNAAVQAHGADEFRKYDAEQTEVGVKQRIDQAVTNYADPKAVRASVAEAKYLVSLFGERNGMSPEQIADHQLAATTQIHAQVIARMVADGKDILANEYFKKVKAEIASETVTKLTDALEVSSTEGEALRGAGDIWNRLGPKTLNDPVTLSQMEQEARDKYTDNPKVVKAVIQELRMRREAHNSEQAEVGAANKAQVLGGFSKGVSIQQLVRTPQYLALSGTDQESVKSYMVREARSEANRPPDKKNWAAYWGYSEPSKLAAMSDNQILALAPEIGQGLVNQLMQQKRAIGKSEETVRSATIDDDLFKTVADDAGLHPYDPKLDEDKRASLGRLKNMTEAEIGRIQGTTGKQMTREDKAKVMRSVIDQKVMRDVFAGTDVERVASTIRKDERGKVYVPLERVNPQFRQEALNWLRSNGVVLQGESDQAALARFQRRIEKAYAARIIGTTAEELDAILRGNQ